jgi:hypothetical protein
VNHDAKLHCSGAGFPGVAEANHDGRWPKFAQSTAVNRVLAFSFLHVDNMGRQVRENPLHLTPYDYI